jgi:glycosyltransferase A (GT-A) superfamily protein (DUF2064 family)
MIAVLVLADPCPGGLGLPDAEHERLQRLLLTRAVSWAQRVAPGAVWALPGESGSPCAMTALPDGVTGLDVGGSGRGERIAAAAAAIFATRAGPLLIVASDFPALGPAHDRAALDDLRSDCDVAVGPSTAGDWYLLALRARDPALVEVARHDRAADTLRAAVEGGLRIGMLRSERPLRTPGDALALRADPIASPELMEILARAPTTISGT